MAIDPSNFHPHNIIDTCAIWNLLSSATLYSNASGASYHFACTSYVTYECLHKRRKTILSTDEELKQRLVRSRKEGHFQEFHLSIDDLAEVAVLERRQNLGKGELSSIALAKKHRLAFMTDDKKARKLASDIYDENMVQTTPHLLGHLFYTLRLFDGDLQTIIKEHEYFNRPLAKYFEQMYRKALEYRIRDATSK